MEETEARIERPRSHRGAGHGLLSFEGIVGGLGAPLGSCVSGKASLCLLCFWLPTLVSLGFTGGFYCTMAFAPEVSKTIIVQDLSVVNHGRCWFFQHFQQFS